LIKTALVNVALTVALAHAAHAAADFALPPKTYYRTAEVKGEKIFYREAGDAALPTIVLLHGYPSSSHTYRELIPMLASNYHVVAPDYLGSGFSAHPDPDTVRYTFDRLADHVEGLLTVLRLERYTIYMQDFGAPVGFRLIERNPAAVSALILQNANAYLDGLTPTRREFFRRAHVDRSPEHVATLFDFTSALAITSKQYLRDVPEEKRDIMSPDAWTHDLAFLSTEKDRKIQVQLFQDYQTNIDRYPMWQALMKKYQFPALIVWGKNDPAFIAAGAEAYLRELPKAELHLIDAGHFAVEENAPLVAKHILEFMARQPAPEAR
jgi:pimeloyl-ACP methyl ester carboxylesterase